MEGHAKVAVYSCLVNALFVAVKYSLGDLSGSLALKADAIHSMADVISAGTILTGILISGRKTRTFPEGLYKVENLVALLSSFFIFYAAYEIAETAVLGESVGLVTHLPLVAAGIFFIICVAFLFSRYEMKVGLQVGSPSLVADAKHVVTDLLSSLVILGGIIGAYFGLAIDRYVALLVAALVARMGFQILLEALKVLLDATLDYTTLDGIRRILESHPDVTEVVSLGGRSSGRFKFVEIAVRMNLRLLRDAHEVTAHLEEEILDQFPEIDKILVHYEPELKDKRLVAVPLSSYGDEGSGIESRLSDHFGSAPIFAVVTKDLTRGSAALSEILVNPHKGEERRKGTLVAEWLASESVDEVRTRADLQGKGAGYALEALRIDQLKTESETLMQLMAELEAEQ